MIPVYIRMQILTRLLQNNMTRLLRNNRKKKDSIDLTEINTER